MKMVTIGFFLDFEEATLLQKLLQGEGIYCQIVKEGKYWNALVEDKESKKSREIISENSSP